MRAGHSHAHADAHGLDIADCRPTHRLHPWRLLTDRGPCTASASGRGGASGCWFGLRLGVTGVSFGGGQRSLVVLPGLEHLDVLGSHHLRFGSGIPRPPVPMEQVPPHVAGKHGEQGPFEHVSPAQLVSAEGTPHLEPEGPGTEEQRHCQREVEPDSLRPGQTLALLRLNRIRRYGRIHVPHPTGDSGRVRLGATGAQRTGRAQTKATALSTKSTVRLVVEQLNRRMAASGVADTGARPGPTAWARRLPGGRPCAWLPAPRAAGPPFRPTCRLIALSTRSLGLAFPGQQQLAT